MKKIAKKNLKLDKEVIASLSENEMVKVTGGGNSRYPECPLSDTNKCPVPVLTNDLKCITIYPPVRYTEEPGCRYTVTSVNVVCDPPIALSDECPESRFCLVSAECQNG